MRRARGKRHARKTIAVMLHLTEAQLRRVGRPLRLGNEHNGFAPDGRAQGCDTAPLPPRSSDEKLAMVVQVLDACVNPRKCHSTLLILQSVAMTV